MKYAFLIGLISMFCMNFNAAAQAPARRYDSSMKIGKAGYRVTCNNRNADKNTINISPIGFSNEVRDFSFEIKGRVVKAEVDDVNRDNFPDLLLYIYSGSDSLNKGNVICVSSEANNSVMPIGFPDIVDDAKLRDGYRGFDEFRVMEGVLTRRFPLFTADSVGAQSTGKMRQVMYRVVPGEKSGFKFQVMRTYDYVKQ